jgi:coenzyme F420-0:L-glutamate ligase/coenzyme F420-1:gamma-L-glutamate ligase
MHATVIAVADELASAADLAGGKAGRRPVVLVRGYQHPVGDGSAAELVMDRAQDLFP